ncbi:UbiX family flavin prenyltransferase [Sporohalobacter salinus]|uniref:UbiX family flavin prenyltransferase n=1 Tax=Sporohalobacter salinus TaxID=1494606 RepID=UPI0019616F6F|nr:4-hydroxy-3-polyprenylbenzoate decarboxylase [Sporohalobacter salinus]
MKRYIVGITGASGSIYAKRLLEVFAAKDFEVYATITNAGQQVWNEEIKVNIRQQLDDNKNINYLDNQDLSVSIASGSFQTDGMVVIPCSMSTLAAIAQGHSSNLLERAADVTLKEKRQLIVVPRETPLNTIHLENMLKLSKLGADIIPPMPAFYNHPQTIDDLVNFAVGRVLDRLGVKNDIYQRWKT